MSRVSSRHESDLRGQLKSFVDTEAMAVAVAIPPATAHLAAVQHTGWMLVNLLARLDGVVERVDLMCPRGIEIAGNTVPLAQQERDLQSAVLYGASQIGIVPVVPVTEIDASAGPIHQFIFIVRAGATLGEDTAAHDHNGGHYYVYGEGWWGGIASEPIQSVEHSALPFGPYAAACLAVAEVFKAARMVPGNAEKVTSAFYSTWHHQASVKPLLGGPPSIEVQLDTALAGVGAVGSTWVHALWASPGVSGRVLLADKDPEGIDKTNLGRYTLFGTGSLGKPKASEAAELCGGAGIEWVPFDRPFEELHSLPPRVVSAVDRNRARRAIQQRYPARILSASTLDLRAELLRCGPPGEGACLSCHNPLEPVVSDDQIRATLLNGSAEERASLAQQTGVSMEELEGWLRTGRCGRASARLLPFIRETGRDLPSEFAVSFVSAMAGTLVAAETVKDYFAVDAPLSDDYPRAVLQFWSPTARTNRVQTFKREPGCSMCSPGTPAANIWRKRFEALGPSRRQSNKLEVA